MAVTTGTRPEKRDYLRAAIHPYDDSARPQEVFEDWNPEYHRLLSHYHGMTGESAILNTSFNLHGYPVVHTPQDALEVFNRSDLTHLALGDFLLAKR
jgi:carbamoyltransferase